MLPQFDWNSEAMVEKREKYNVISRCPTCPDLEMYHPEENTFRCEQSQGRQRNGEAEEVGVM